MPRLLLAIALLAVSVEVEAGAPRTSAATLADPYVGEPSVVVGSRLYLLGGHTDMGPSDRIQWYDAAAEASGFLGSRLPRSGAVASVLADDVVVLAYSGSQCAVPVGCYNFAILEPAADHLQVLAAPSTVREEAGLVPVLAWHATGSSLFGCSGGCVVAFVPNGEVHAIDPSSGAARLVTTGDFRGMQASFTVGTSTYLFGGSIDGGSIDGRIWRFDASTGALEVLPARLPCNCTLRALGHGQEALLLGMMSFPGFNRLDTVAAFDHASQRVQTKSWRMPVTMNGFAGAILNEDVILAGGNDGSRILDTVWHRPLANDPPNVQAWGPSYSPRAGESTTFEASASDADGSIASLSWNFGDGTTVAGGQVTHAFAATGTYTVKATATDNEGATASRSLNVTVIAQPTSSATSSSSGTSTAPAAPPSNQPPVAKPSCQANGMTAHCSALGSTDPEDQALSFTWSWGDGATSTGSPVSHTYAVPGAYSITLTANDGELSSSSAVQVMVQTITPSASQTQTATTSLASMSHSASATLAAVEEAPEEASSLTAGALLALAFAAVSRRRK